jgi:hypothetical protein
MKQYSRPQGKNIGKGVFFKFVRFRQRWDEISIAVRLNQPFENIKKNTPSVCGIGGV